MSNNTKVFYIDDDDDDIELVKITLSELNESMCSFHRASDLLHLLENPPPQPSIVIVDMNMPVIDGTDVLAQIRESDKFADIPVIMYSTTATPPKIEKCKRLGANLYMIKGFSPKSIKKGLKHILNIDWKTFQVSESNFVVDYT